MQLRPFQKAALDALVFSPSHVLCVAPTGAGKSLIYEQSAKSPGTRMVLITPLVALARQQYRKLRSLGIPTAFASGQDHDSPPQSGVWILSPETLQYESKKAMLKNWRPNLLVVDECHCLWDWGETFRPAFSLIPDLIQNLNIERSLWLTATLPYDARLQLRKALPHSLKEIGEFSISPQIQLWVHSVDWVDRAQFLIQWLQKVEGQGLIFVSSREATLKLARLLQAIGKKVQIYHGGMGSEERRNIENQVSQEIPDIVITTSAFGMGMDYPHLKFVVLWQIPTSLLALVQAIGRVGRNLNQIGYALVLWHHEDFRLLEWSIQGSKRRKSELKALHGYLHSPGCRINGLINYFDKKLLNNSCSQCDYCLKNKIQTFFI